MYTSSYASAPVPSSPSYLQSLVETIADGVKNVEVGCARRGVSYPTPNVPWNPETDAIQGSFAKDAEPILAAAYQLIATFSYPAPYLLGMGIWGYYPAALTVAEKGFIPDILREAAPQGVHVKEIAAISGLEPTKLARTLRFLCTRHIFEEVAPNVFRNTRLSSALCTGKPVRELQARPEDRWDGTNGIAAVTAFSGDDGLKSAAYLLDHMFDPVASRSQEPNVGPMQRAFNTNLPLYDWMDKPENALVSKKFQIGMNATGNHSFDTVATHGFNWSTLAPGSVVVDVGGGVGSVTMALAATHRHLRYVIQDRAQVIEQAHGLWAQKMPGTIESGLVRLQTHDMFEKQPVKNASVFLMRYITHNWSDKYCRILLRQLREVASPSTKIVVIDHIQDHQCRSNDLAKGVPGAYKPPAPEPLLPYPESATGLGYLLDMQMMGMLNCQERTVTGFIELFESAGWKLERIHRFDSPLPHELVFSPIPSEGAQYKAKL